MSRRTVFVLGMGRSGTSTVAAVLRSLGVEWGPDELMMPVHSANPLGFWEFTPLYDINVQILERFGGDWHKPPTLPDNWERSEDLGDLRESARNHISNHFKSDLWGFKDPRCCLTLPFWSYVIDNPIECVVPIRNPLEVASSLLRRDNTPIHQGALLWGLYVKWAWEASRGLRRHFVEYQSFLDNPEEEARNLQRFLRMKVCAEDCQKAASTIEKTLKHEAFSTDDLWEHGDVPVTTKRLYSALVQLTRGEVAAEEVEKAIAEVPQCLPSF